MKYMVTLNGKKYEIEVEEGQAIVNSVTTAPMAGAPVAAAPAVAPAPVAAPAAPAPAPAPGPCRCTRCACRSGRWHKRCVPNARHDFRRKGIGWSGC